MFLASVMDDIRAKFLELPTEPKRDETNADKE